MSYIGVEGVPVPPSDVTEGKLNSPFFPPPDCLHFSNRKLEGLCEILVFNKHTNLNTFYSFKMYSNRSKCSDDTKSVQVFMQGSLLQERIIPAHRQMQQSKMYFFTKKCERGADRALLPLGIVICPYPVTSIQL